ncbi:hypothetical protein KC850_04455, partial [Candidatus Kaiserbacteria bacterium]|nr:hypothetical protein [Candidatus Kaiserbacteria bacterium]
MNSKNIVIGILVLVLIGAISYLLLNNGGDTTVVVEKPTSDEILPVEPDEGIGDGATPIEEVEMMEREDETNIGTSVNGDDITAYHFGTG